MKFTVPVQTIIGPISQVASICTTNASNPDDLTQFVLFDVTKERLTLVGTDNTVQLKAEIPLPEDACQKEGSFLMLATKAKDFFKNLGTHDDVSFEIKDDEDEVLNVISSQARYSIRIHSTTDDQFLPSFDEDFKEEKQVSFKIEENKLLYMIDKSLFCASRDNFQEFFKGVRFEIRGDELSVFALDGHRMAALDVRLEERPVEDISFLMTLRGVSELQKLLTSSKTDKLELVVSSSFVNVNISCFSITNRLLKCSFPAVRSILPKQFSPEVVINVEELKTYVKRVSFFSNKRLGLINLVFSQNSLGLHSQNSDHEIAAARLDIPFDDDHREINLNADYLLNFLSAIEAPEVVFCFAPPYNNTLLRPVNEINEMGIRVRYVVSHIMVQLFHDLSWIR